MRKALLIGLFTLAAGPSFAQTDDTPRTPDAGPEQAQEAPAQEETPATSAPPETEAEAAPPPAAQPDAGQPANLCQELLSFMQTPPPEPAAPTEAAPAQQEQSGGNQESPESEGTAQEGQGTAQEGEGTPQQASGGSEGPAHAAPDPQSAGSGGSDAEGDNEQAQQTSSLSAPVPTEPASTPKLEVMTVDQAEDLAAANDIQACKDAARELRLAGVAVPPPLLALTALDLQYQQTESQAQ